MACAHSVGSAGAYGALGSPSGRAAELARLRGLFRIPSPPQCAHWGTSPKGRGKWGVTYSHQVRRNGNLPAAQSPLPLSRGMIATGNHVNFNSLRVAPPFTQGGHDSKTGTCYHSTERSKPVTKAGRSRPAPTGSWPTGICRPTGSQGKIKSVNSVRFQTECGKILLLKSVVSRDSTDFFWRQFHEHFGN